MSTDDISNAPVVRDAPDAPVARDRREALREKAQQVRVRQARARVARRSAIGAAIVSVVAVVAVVVVWVVAVSFGRAQTSPANVAGDGFAVSAVPAGAVNNTAMTDLGTAAPTTTPSAQPVVDIRVYVDYLSAGAREWQVANADQLAKWVDNGTVSLTYYPVAMLTAKSNGTKYSLRAANAAACVATYAPTTFFAFNSELLARQPAVDTDGFSDADLADLAQASGVPDPKRVRGCIEEAAFQSWVKDATERAISGIPDTDGLALTGTPTVLVNGSPYIGALDNAVEFSQFVLTSSSDAYYDPSPTPTPSATPGSTSSPEPAGAGEPADSGDDD